MKLDDQVALIVRGASDELILQIIKSLGKFARDIEPDDKSGVDYVDYTKALAMRDALIEDFTQVLKEAY